MSSHNPAPHRAGPHRLAVLALAALSLLSTVAFVLAPVERPDAVYSWPSAGNGTEAVAIPLMTSTPARLGATVGCDAARAAGSGDVLLSSLPLQDVPGDEVLDGLRVTATDDGLLFRTGGTDLPVQPVPASGSCTWTLVSTADGTTLRLDGDVVDQ